MDIVKLNPEQFGQWDEYVLNHPNSIAWHLTEWNDVLQLVYQPEFLPYVAKEDDKICGILPLFRGTTPMGKNYLISVPYAVAGGMVVDNDQVAETLIQQAVELSKQYEIGSITFKQYKHKMPGDLRVDENYFNRETTISNGKDPVWEELSDHNKSVIEKMEKLELKMEYPSKDVDTFYNCVMKHHQKRGIPGPGFEWIKALVSCEMYQIALLKHEGKVVAATMAKEFRDTVSFPYSSTLDLSEKSFDYMIALYWKIISHYIDKKFRVFHSGRIPQTEDVDSFRLGWGGEKFQYYYQYYPNTNIQTEYKAKRGLKRKVATAVFKRLPMPIFKSISPRITSNFP